MTSKSISNFLGRREKRCTAWVSTAELLAAPQSRLQGIAGVRDALDLGIQLKGLAVDGRVTLRAIIDAVDVSFLFYIDVEELSLSLWDSSCKTKLGETRSYGPIARTSGQGLDLSEGFSGLQQPVPGDEAHPGWDPSHGTWLRLDFVCMTSGQLYSISKVRARQHEAVNRLRAGITALMPPAPAPDGCFVVRAADEDSSSAQTWVHTLRARQLGLEGLAAYADALRGASSTGMGGVPGTVAFHGSARVMRTLLFASALAGDGEACTDANYVLALLAMAGTWVADLPALVEATVTLAAPGSPLRTAMASVARTGALAAMQDPVVALLYLGVFVHLGVAEVEEREQALDKMKLFVDGALTRMRRDGDGGGGEQAEEVVKLRRVLGLMLEADPHLRNWSLLASHAGMLQLPPTTEGAEAVSLEAYVSAGMWLLQKDSRKRSRSGSSSSAGAGERAAMEEAWRDLEKARCKARRFVKDRVRRWLTLAVRHGLATEAV